jgi:RNA polymerase sigma factor (sigma-70 family)
MISLSTGSVRHKSGAAIGQATRSPGRRILMGGGAVEVDEALSSLVADSGDRLLRVAYQLTHERAAAQDLVQEAILRVYGSIRRRHHSPDDLYAYLRRAVLNEFLRTRRLRSSTELVTDSMPATTVVGVEEAVVDRAALWGRLAELSERQRAVLVLRHYERLTDSEIAEVLGCRQSTVRSLAMRGLVALRSAVVFEEERE